MSVDLERRESTDATSLRCLLCGGDRLKVFFHLKRFPLYIGVVPKDRADSNPCWPLRAALCLDCGHCQQETPPPEDALAGLYSHDYSCHSPVLSGIGAEILDRFLEFLKPRLPHARTLRVLEIGCYDGYVLDKLKTLGHEVEGCDPSQGADIAREKLELNVRKEFFRDGLYPAASFDVVIARHIIEHLLSPVEFLRSVARILRPGGCVVLETPNYAYSLRHCLWGNFHIEHVSYFTPCSLRLTTHKAGFRTTDGDWGQFMYAVGKVGPDKAEPAGVVPHHELDLELAAIRRLTDEFQAQVCAFAENLGTLLQSLKSAGCTIAIYGAGGHTTSLWALEVIDPSWFEYVVDGDPRKWGQLVSGFNVQVSPPDRLCRDSVDYILLSSDVYEEEMLANIRDRLRIQSKVIRLYPQVAVLDSVPA